MPSTGFRWFSRFRSFVFAARGLHQLLSTQHNAWLHAAATVGVIALGAFYDLDRVEWALLVLAMVCVWTSEALNTALEFVCDAVSAEFHPLIGKAKDVAAGAVLICAVGAACVGALVFYPYVRATFPSAAPSEVRSSP